MGECLLCGDEEVEVQRGVFTCDCPQRGYVSAKCFPTDPRGLEDAGDHVAAKPCCARLNTIPLSWCTKPDGHEGPCAAPVMRPLSGDEPGPVAAKRRRW